MLENLLLTLNWLGVQGHHVIDFVRSPFGMLILLFVLLTEQKFLPVVRVIALLIAPWIMLGAFFSSSSATVNPSARFTLWVGCCARPWG